MTMKVNEVFGNILKQKRKDLGLKLKEVDEEINVSYTALSKIEKGKYCPSSKQLVKLTSFYGITPEELLSETEKIFAGQFENPYDSEEFEEGQDLLYMDIDEPLRAFRVEELEKARNQMAKAIKHYSRVFNGKMGFDPIWTEPDILKQEEIENMREVLEKDLALIFNWRKNHKK